MAKVRPKTKTPGCDTRLGPGNTPTEPPTPITELTGRVLGRLDLLTRRIASLGIRLVPVLRPGGQGGAQPHAPIPAESPLTAFLRDMEQTISDQGDVIDDLLNRLEI